MVNLQVNRNIGLSCVFREDHMEDRLRFNIRIELTSPGNFSRELRRLSALPDYSNTHRVLEKFLQSFLMCSEKGLCSKFFFEGRIR